MIFLFKNLILVLKKRADLSVLFFCKKRGPLGTLFTRFFAKKNRVFSFLIHIGNYWRKTKNPRAVENSRVKKKNLAISYLLFYNFKC